jgi:hypothetical protein
MARDKKLTEQQKRIIVRLEPKLKASVKLCNFERAKIIIQELQELLPKEGNKNLILQYKNWFFECAIDNDKLEYAISGLSGVIQSTSNTTRIYLEANALLSIAYIRKGDIEKSKKYISIVINKIKVISSNTRRIEFYDSYLKRLEDEIILSRIKRNGCDELTVDGVHKRAVELVQQKNENDIYELMGQEIPGNVFGILDEIKDEVFRQISAPDKKLLESPVDHTKNRENGLRLNSAVRKVVWKSLCDPEDEVYKAWSKGLSLVHDKKYIATAITAVFIKEQICFGLLAASVVALAIRFGVNIFCEMYEPGVLMERKKKKK